MPKFLTIHDENITDRVLIESRLTEISSDPRAEWEIALLTSDLRRRFCEWDAPNRQAIEELLWDHQINWSQIVEVEVTSASRWRLWEIEWGKEIRRCWEVGNCGREPDGADLKSRGFCPAAVNSRQPEHHRRELGEQRLGERVGMPSAETLPEPPLETRLDSEMAGARAELEQGERLPL